MIIPLISQPTWPTVIREIELGTIEPCSMLAGVYIGCLPRSYSVTAHSKVSLSYPVHNTPGRSSSLTAVLLTQVNSLTAAVDTFVFSFVVFGLSEVCFSRVNTCKSERKILYCAAVELAFVRMSSIVHAVTPPPSMRAHYANLYVIRHHSGSCHLTWAPVAAMLNGRVHAALPSRNQGSEMFARVPAGVGSSGAEIWSRESSLVRWYSAIS